MGKKAHREACQPSNTGPIGRQLWLSLFHQVLVTMLARLLRRLYLFQVISGALLGAYLATRVAHPGSGALSLLLVPLGAVLVPLLLQLLVIGTSMVRSSSMGFGSPWWRAFWGEFQAALTVFVFRLPWSDRPPGVLMPLTGTTPVTGDKPLPVLLVHGYICNHRVWDDITPALRQAGHPVLALDLEPLFTPIDDYAGLVEQAVINLLATTGATQVTLVGHSMGGLVIRAWMRAHGTRRVARVITLGTPHQGTRIAKASMTPNGAQMEWHSPWLQALEHSETRATRSLIRIALTHQDNIVYPQREQVLAGASITEFDGVGHLELCLDTTVIGWLVQQLKAGTADEPAAVNHAPHTAQ